MHSIIFKTLLVIACSLAPMVMANPTGVYVQKVEQQPFSDRIEALGTLRAYESVVLTTSVTNRITAIGFRDGERVSKGQLLVELNNLEEKAQQQELSLVVNEARRQYERVKKLAQDGLAPQSQLDEQRRTYQAAQARLDALAARMQEMQIVAPFAGVVGLRTVSVGTLLSAGQPITTLDDDTVMKLDFSVPSTYLPYLKPGLKVTAQAKALGNQGFEGEVVSIDSRVDPITRSIVVRALIDNPHYSLRPGLLMTVTLQKAPRRALIIAEEALVPEGRQHFVMRVNTEATPATVEKVAVEVGSRIPGQVEILAGLAAGDLVITHGTVKVRQGSAVNILATQALGERLPDLLQRTGGQ
ncbi:efflux RND transporter periplasmic adaptor subunit [Simiduia sp. 21SJ11W-1]|uniref:efflux RND transporter periplasmic adaptor subunit n=1 Tax=Simiduia sp. 21SJ11W-1 TaxID=2909669 RepID=UPI00209CA4BE|nr:efflux RND transporter periplasmic adaptor subunit [Simiduia sp. 21SJ11W-1]UTA49040.1 efflux RND transporter periplasmic adaptor subunit [Simiduia sp. 21SJ11W-1]